MPDSTLTKKLGIRPGHRLLVLNAPEGYVKMIGGFPEAAKTETRTSGKYDLAQVFARSRAEVEAHAGTAMQAAKPDGRLWFSYPKKTSAMKADINRDSGWEPLN